MELKSLQNQFETLSETSPVHFQKLSQLFLVIFYSFCTIFISITSVKFGTRLFFIITTPLILYYMIIIFSLIKGTIGINNLNPHTRKYSVVGLIFASIHQMYLISVWDPNYQLSLTVLYFILVLEILLLYNISFNNKIRLLLLYFKKVEETSVETN